MNEPHDDLAPRSAPILPPPSGHVPEPCLCGAETEAECVCRGRDTEIDL